MTDTPFDTTPSSEHIAAKNAVEAASHQFRQAQESAHARGVWPINDPDCMRASQMLDTACKALNATPEQKFLDEVQAAEDAATDQFFNDELVRRGRQITALFFDTDLSRYATMEAALDATGLSYRMIEPLRHTTIEASTAGLSPLTVLADMRRLSAAQLVRILRWMADEIVENGVAVYNGPAPSEKFCPDWWAHEFPNGKLHHVCYPRPKDGDD